MLTEMFNLAVELCRLAPGLAHLHGLGEDGGGEGPGRAVGRHGQVWY